MTQVPGRGVLTAAEKRILRSLEVGDVVEVHRVERITVAERTEFGVFPCLIDSAGNIADDLTDVRVISRAPRPLAAGEVRVDDLGASHLGKWIALLSLPGIGPTRGQLTMIHDARGGCRNVVAMVHGPGDTHVPVAVTLRLGDGILLHDTEEST